MCLIINKQSCISVLIFAKKKRNRNKKKQVYFKGVKTLISTPNKPQEKDEPCLFSVLSFQSCSKNKTPFKREIYCTSSASSICLPASHKARRNLSFQGKDLTWCDGAPWGSLWMQKLHENGYILTDDSEVHSSEVHNSLCAFIYVWMLLNKMWRKLKCF